MIFANLLVIFIKIIVFIFIIIIISIIIINLNYACAKMLFLTFAKKDHIARCPKGVRPSQGLRKG